VNRGAFFTTVVPAIAIPFLMIAYARERHLWQWWQVLGLGVVAVGLVLLTTARIQLGNSFSIRPEARELVTGGLYRRVRHPVYVFGTLTITGLLLYLNVLPALLVILVVIPIQFVRARAEERVLEEHFGQQYRDYRAQTWF
jgi:protein-S-isoprenylcysteine O-methyltransferase Ste14